MSFENLKKFLTLPKAQAGMTVGQNPYNSYTQLNDYLNNMGSTQQGVYQPVNLQSNANTNGYEALNTRLNNMPSSQVGIYQPVNLGNQVPMVYNSQTGQYENAPSSGMASAGNTPYAQQTDFTIPDYVTEGLGNRMMAENQSPPQYNYSQAEDPIYQNITKWNNPTAPISTAQTAQEAGYTEPAEDNRFNLFNPFGGIDNSTALSYGFYNLGQGNTGQGLLGLGKGILGSARQGFSAYGAGKSQRDLLNRQNNQSIINTNYLEKGGSVSVGKFLSGKYITDSSNPNVEIEVKEKTLNSVTGEVQTAVGETHEKGGIKTNLPDGSKVLSDHTKIGAQNAKQLSKELDIKVKAKNTFADVLDKYSKKIGVEKNIEEGEKLVEKTEETLKMEETDTKQINMDFIQQETARIEAEKEELNTQQQEAFKTIFDKQEAQKEINFLQRGGEIAPAAQEQEMNPDDIIVQVQQAIAQGTQIEEILNSLLSMGYSEEQSSQIIQASQSQQQPQMAEGGQTGQGEQRIGDFLKSALAIAQAKGVAPPDVDLSKGNLTQNWTALQNWFVKNAPEEVVSYFDDQPITNKGMDLLLKNRKDDLKKLGIDTNRKPNSFTAEEKRAIQEAIPLDNKFLLDQFADGIPDYRFPVTAINSPTSTESTNQPIQATFMGNMQDQNNIVPIEDEIAIENQTTQKTQQQGRNAIPMLPVVEGLAPSAALIPRSDQVRFNRIEPTLRTPEASIATINNQANFLNEQGFLSNPNLASFLTATNLGTTQQSANKAIAETDTYNAEAINRANQYNANIGDKEQLMNINLAQNYEQRLFKTADNQEQAWSRFLINKQLQNKQNWMDVNNLNLTNAMTPNYQTDGSNVYFSNPRQYNQVNPELQAQQQMWQNMTPEQRAEYINNYKQDGGYIYEFEEGAQPMSDQQAREVAKATGFTEDFAREYFRQQGNPTGAMVTQQPQRRSTLNLESDRIADITAGTNRYTPDGGVIVGDYRKVWLNNRPEYFTGRTQPQEGTDFTYLSAQDFAKFQKSQNYKNYKSGYQTTTVASK